MKNIKIFQLICLSVLLFSCKSVKDTSCTERFELQKELLDPNNQDTEHKIAYGIAGKAFAIKYIGNFDNDTLSLFVNDKFHSKINIERSSDIDEKSYGSVISIFEKMDSPTLKIISRNKKNCITMKLDWKYPLIYVWLENEKWIVRYSNFYHSDNLKRTAYNSRLAQERFCFSKP